MNLKEEIVEYTLIDERKPYDKSLFNSNNYFAVLHEYLLTLKHNLSLLNNNNNTNLITTNFYIVQRILFANKKYPFITNKYTLNLNTLNIQSKDGFENLPTFYPFSEIKSEFEQLLKYEKPIFIKHQDKKISQTNIKTELNKNSYIPKINSPVEHRPFNTNIKEKNVNNPDNENSLSESELIKQIEELQKHKEKEEENICNIEKEYDDNQKNLSNYCDNLNDEKRTMRINKEKEEEKKRIFDSDKRVYDKLKLDIQKNKIDESKIPELFSMKYPIFKFMDENNLLNNDDDYETYLCFYDEIYPPPKSTNTQEYVPHNVHYLSNEEQEKYKNIKDKHKDIIEEFLYKKNNNTEKKYPSLEEIDQLLDSSSDDLPEFDNFE